MSKTPIISKIVYQRCVGYRFTTNACISIFENYGHDQDGKLWRWRTEYEHNYVTGIERHFSDYGYERAAVVPEVKECE